ncbi:type IV pilus biogenesis protein PilP [Paraburkholderia sp. BCC1885]|uniref:type IV pilus biogenesis protein PilP n=1 Tax=Paraburkholderia sp. BCC1885 TaxID=2562669 RepID=UPI001181F94F|nr:type IV pilus biogenesis protein PilP [Paraburkholderia sp. BCC1885]
MKRKTTFFMLVSLPVAALAAAPDAAVPGANVPAATGIPAAAPATAVINAPAPMTASERLADLQAQIPLLQAQDQIAKLKHDIAVNEGNAQMGAPGSMLPPLGAAVAPALPVVSQKAPARAPIRAVAVNAFDGRYSAVLDVDGRTMTVRIGDSVADGWRVSVITEASVTLANGKQVRILKV